MKKQPLTGTASDAAQSLEWLTRCKSLLNSGDAEAEYDGRELLKELYIVHDYGKDGNRKVGTYSCGSMPMANTPQSLYRAMFLFGPKSVSFADMYKTTLLTLVSQDHKLVAEVDLFKYELAVYFQAAEEYVQGRQNVIIAGLPGTNNGIQFKGEFPTLWFGLLVDVLNREWEVYGGNNFAV